MRGYLLDTNVISELKRSRPDSGVIEWFQDKQTSELYLASMTIAELMRGAHKLTDAVRKQFFLDWIDNTVIVQFDRRILSFDNAAAREWGLLMGLNDARGETLPSADAQIAAIARVNQLHIVSRNVKDFRRMLDTVIDPFAQSV